MQVFKHRLSDNGLGPVRTVGSLFTWTNCIPQNLIMRRLDRMIANQAWFSMHTEGFLHVANRGVMDHCPIIFQEPMQLEKFGKPFQFFKLYG